MAHREEARDLMRQVQEKCMEYDPDRKVCLFTPHFYLACSSPQPAFDHHRIHCRQYLKQPRPSDRAVPSRFTCRRHERSTWYYASLGRRTGWLRSGQCVEVCPYMLITASRATDAPMCDQILPKPFASPRNCCPTRKQSTKSGCKAKG